MCEKAASFGMNLSSEICNIFEILDQNDAVTDSRYIVTGFKKRIDNQQLLALVEEVRAEVKISHAAAGVQLGATSALPS